MSAETTLNESSKKPVGIPTLSQPEIEVLKARWSQSEIDAIKTEVDDSAHPAARAFGWLIDTNPTLFWATLADIAKKRGQEHPAIRNKSGVLLAGRTRAMICKMLGIALKTETRDLEGDAAVKFIFSDNFFRAEHD